MALVNYESFNNSSLILINVSYKCKMIIGKVGVEYVGTHCIISIIFLQI